MKSRNDLCRAVEFRCVKMMNLKFPWHGIQFHVRKSNCDIFKLVGSHCQFYLEKNICKVFIKNTKAVALLNLLGGKVL